MRYIRTKDGVYEIERYYEPGDYYWVKQDCDQPIGSDEIIKQADTIEELTEFIIHCHKDGELDFYKYDFETDWCCYYGDQYYSETLEFFRKGNYDGSIYASIKTDKGLIYIAKMNGEGVLELL